MPSIRDFSGGVVNQELQNRDNGAGVIYDCKNVLSSWNGELRKRTGTHWLLSLPSYQRTIPYRLPSGNDIVLLVGDNKITGYEFISDGTLKPFYIYSGTAPTFPTTGWAGNTTNGDYVIALSSESASSTWGLGFDTPTATSPMTYYGKGSLWTGGYRSTTNVPAYIYISSASAQLLNSVNIRWTNSVNGNRPGHYKGWVNPTLQYSDDGVTWTSIQTETSNPYPTGGSDYYQASYHYGSGSGEKTENYTVYKVTNIDHDTAHRYWRIYCAQRITNTQTYDGERIDLNVSDVIYLSTTKSQLVIDTSGSFQITSSNVDNIKFSQNDTLMILTNGSDKPYKLQYSGGAMAYGTYNTSLDNNQGNPSCVYFYQNRLWFGGFSAFPTRVWGSAFGNFTDFTIPATVLSTSPISVDSVEIKSRIENMWGGNNALYCLSEDGISMINAQGGVVATDQIEFKLRNREPVDSMTPTFKDDIMMYLGRDKRKILITDYDYVVQRFKAQNVSLGYTDFLLEGIRELHYIPDHDSLIYGLLTDGSWFVLLFDVDRGKNAIFPLDTNGKIYDIQPVKYGSKTFLVMLTQRDGVFMLEKKLYAPDQKKMDFMTTAEQQAYTQTVVRSSNGFLDCLVERTYQTATSTISNVPYAPNSTVSVIADGYYIGERELTPGLSSSLYAWRYDTEIVYTTTTSPSTSTVLYNEDLSEKTGYSISSVGTNLINVTYTQTTIIPYYGYNHINSIIINPASGYSGEFYRYSAGDGSISYYTSAGRLVTVSAFAWEQEGTVIYTFNSSPSVGDRWIINGASIASSSTIASISTPENAFVKVTTLAVGASVYDSSFAQIGTISSVINNIIIAGVTYTGFVCNSKTYVRNTGIDTTQTVTEQVTNAFARSSDEDISSHTVSLVLDTPVNHVIMGYTYDSYAVIKFVSPYNIRKFPKEISVNFINSGYLEVGNSFDSLKSVLNNLVESVSISNSVILMNGNYTKTLDKQAFETPYVIVRSDKGLPFMITGIDYKIDTSNYQGGV